jgi:hypothetical protein
MTTAEHLDTIDRLRALDFAPEPGRSGGHISGPGYHLVELSRTADFWEDDGSGRIEATDQINAEYGALAQAVTGRWGEPQVFTVGSLLEREFGGEEIAEPWGMLGRTTDHVHLWRAGERWLVVCVTRAGSHEPYVLTACVTVVDPP